MRLFLHFPHSLGYLENQRAEQDGGSLTEERIPEKDSEANSMPEPATLGEGQLGNLVLEDEQRGDLGELPENN